MIKKLITNLIRFYQRINSALWGSNFGVIYNSGCRFHPSCSEYAIDAINKYGSLKGSFVALWRVTRCNPLSQGGIDLI
jgi:uncharacterized protein